MTLRRSLRAGSVFALSTVLPGFAAGYVGSAYEGFDYTAGAISGTFNGGTGWNATGDNSANTAAWGVGTSLTSSGSGAAAQAGSLDLSTLGYPAETGGSAIVSGATASSSIGRQFGQSVDTGTFYFSFLTQKTNTELRTVNLSFFGTNERFAVGQIASNLNTRDPDGNWLSNAGANSGNFVVLISNSQNNAAAANTVGPAANGVYVNTTAPVAYPSASVALIVGKIEFNFAGGVEDRLTLYVNPGDLADEGALTSYLVIDHNDFGALTGFRIFSGTTGNGFNASGGIFDEIRFGTTYASVVNAPSATTPWQDWLGTHFTVEERSQPSISGEAADPDGDGGSNLLEYAFGSDPRTSSVGPGPAVGTGAGTLVLDYPAPRADLTYIVETSADLAAWTTAGVTNGASVGTPGWNTASVARADNQRVFLRVRVTKP